MNGRLLPLLAAAVAAAWAAWGVGCTEVIDHGVTPCTPQTCDGCCTQEGQCAPGDAQYACGADGQSCQACNLTDRCEAGACVATRPPPPPDGGDTGDACGPQTCAGCCAGETCVLAPSVTACGTAGEACTACAAGERCVDGGCEPVPLACDLRTSVQPYGTAGLIDFGQASTGGTHQVDVVLTNAGTATCQVTAPTWEPTADRNAFSFGGPVQPLTLDPGDQGGFGVYFSPYADREWTDLTDAFTFTANDAAASQCASGVPGCRRVLLRGVGVASAHLPGAPLLPRTLDFGEVAVGCESGYRPVVLVNESAIGLEVTQVAASGEGFEVVAPALPLTLPAWGTLQVQVRFAPQAPGPVTAALDVTDALGGTREVYLLAEGVGAVTRSESFIQPADAFADVLLVVHDGPGMGQLQADLAQAVPALVSAAEQAGGSWRFGVLASDATQASAGRLQGTPPYVNASASAPEDALASNVRVGVEGSLDQSLESLRLAVLPPNASDPLRNGTFFRAGARTAVVAVSGDAESSAAPVADYALALAVARGVRVGSDDLRFWAVEAGGCQAGSRYLAAASVLGGGCLSLVGTTLDAAMVQVAQDLFVRRVEHTLEEPVDVSLPITVTVDGVPVSGSQAFTVDAATNALRFMPGYVPAPGQQIDVTYTPSCHP